MGASPSVERVQKNSAAAAAKIEEMNTSMMAKSAERKEEFRQHIIESLHDANVNDGRFVNHSIEMKVEYTKEIDIDKLADIVKSAINAFGAATGEEGKPTAKSATSKQALEAYSDVVSRIAEAAKSKSDASTDYSFSMDRLGPGMFAFLYVMSSSLYDKATFGTESITGTCFQYQFVMSIDDIKNTTEFDKAIIQAATFKAAAICDKEGILKWKEMQLKLIDRVASGELTPDSYMKLDAFYQLRIQTLQKLLDDEHFPITEALSLTMAALPSKETTRNYGSINIPMKKRLTRMDLDKLQTIITQMDKTSDQSILQSYHDVADDTMKRIQDTHYGRLLLDANHMSIPTR